jgi:hypothetical protein
VRLAAEAVLFLALAALTLKAASFVAVARWAGGTPRSGELGEHPAQARRVAWAVEAAARRVPWRTACFAEALACHAMLRRRGLASRLYYGARSGGAQPPVAHVWVMSGETALVGARAAGQVALLATFPPASERNDTDTDRVTRT